MVGKESKKFLANALRFLSIDAIQLANSGHPGMPLGMADIATVLWHDFLQHNPKNPSWINRDRFVLSNGHGSMLLYALLHLTGYDINLRDLQQFRQLHSKTPGHPEYNINLGIEATTGPLGQGIGMAVGMALAEHLLAKTFNRDHFNIIDHYTYCFAGDGCLMEGVSHEVCSLAGTLGLNKLILFWDNNQVSIDGNTASWFNEDVPQRFTAYNWHVIDNIDGHNEHAISAAILEAKRQQHKPTLLCCKTIIGYGAPNIQGSAQAHGAPLSTAENIATRKNLAWEYSAFEIPAAIYKAWDASNRGMLINTAWDEKLRQYKARYPELYLEFSRRGQGLLPDGLQRGIDRLLNATIANPQNIATRASSKLVLDVLGQELPELFGGSADLSTSNLTLFDQANDFDIAKPPSSIFNYLHYGVREFGMFCIQNGMALHKCFIPYGGTFLAFVDYAKAALRLSAIMKQRVIYVLTHDSIGLGEDGPTHQPIEHLGMLRMIPDVSVWRPCDTVETIIAWEQAIVSNELLTTCLILSKQPLRQQQRDRNQIAQIKYGGYILYQTSQQPEVIIIATGSEVELVMQAANRLQSDHFIAVRVVSMPNINVFLQQDAAYQQQVLPKNILIRVAVEAGNTFVWHQFVGAHGKVIGINKFGMSGKHQQVYDALELNVNTIIITVVELYLG